MERRAYHTEGRERLLHFFASHPDCQFTADELCRAVNGTEEGGKSSIYRRLSELCEAESVRKFRNDERKCSVYQYVGKECDCKSHFHAKCVCCGGIEHLDCGDSLEFAGHLLAEHGFEIDCGQSMLYGLCAKCRAKKGGSL